MTDFDSLRKKFGMGNVQKNIVDNLVQVPIVDKGVNVPITQVYETNNTHQVDLLYLPEDNGYKQALVCVDLASSYIGAEPLKDSKSSEEALKALLKIYKRSKYLKIPQRLEMDQGAEFKGDFYSYFQNLGVVMRYKRTGRHRSQSKVETWNGIIGKYLNKRMLSNEIHIKGEELIGDWVGDLQDLVNLLNHITETKKHTLNKVQTERKKLSHNNTLPVGTGSSLDVLRIGTPVRVILDEPRDIQDSKLHGTFRKGDIRWNKKPHKIENLSIRPNEPIMYLVDGITNAAYTKNQLQVIPENERPPPKEAISKFIAEKVIEKDLETKGLVRYIVKWKGYPDSENTSQLIKDIPPQLLKDFRNSEKIKNKMNMNLQKAKK